MAIDQYEFLNVNQIYITYARLHRLSDHETLIVPHQTIVKLFLTIRLVLQRYL